MSEKKQRELRVRCLVLDHDDTVVKSTPEINFPAFLRSLKDLRGTTMSYEQFVEYNFDPGFYEMCADILHYTPEEIRYQEAEWERAAAVTIPAVYEGLPEILHTYMENGGKICVSSHSMRKTILRDYDAGTYFRLGMSGGEKKAASLCIAGNHAYSEFKAGGTSHGG